MNANVLNKTTYHVTPIKCNSCVRKIQLELSSIPKIYRVDVSIIFNEVTVLYDQSIVSSNDIRCILIGIGFQVDMLKTEILQQTKHELERNDTMYENSSDTNISTTSQALTLELISSNNLNTQNEYLNSSFESYQHIETKIIKIKIAKVKDRKATTNIVRKVFYNIENMYGIHLVQEIYIKNNTFEFMVTYDRNSITLSKLYLLLNSSLNTANKCNYKIYTSADTKSIFKNNLITSSNIAYKVIIMLLIISFSIYLKRNEFFIKSNLLQDFIRSNFIINVQRNNEAEIVNKLDAITFRTSIALNFIAVALSYLAHLYTVFVLCRNMYINSWKQLKNKNVTSDILICINSSIAILLAISEFVSNFSINYSTTQIEQYKLNKYLHKGMLRGTQDNELNGFTNYIYRIICTISYCPISVYSFTSIALIAISLFGGLVQAYIKYSIVRQIKNRKCLNDEIQIIQSVLENTETITLKPEFSSDIFPNCEKACIIEEDLLLSKLSNYSKLTKNAIELSLCFCKNARDGQIFNTKTITKSFITEGDIIIIGPATTIPFDILILLCYENDSYINLHKLDGNQTTKTCIPGMYIDEGSHLVGTKPLIGIVTKLGDSTILGNLEASVVASIKTTNNTNISESLDQYSKYLILTMLLLSLSTMLFWFIKVKQTPGIVEVITGNYIIDSIYFIFSFPLSVLTFTCPCAFTLSAPIAYSCSIILLYSKNIIIKNLSVFENFKKLNTIIFDKTGTIESSDYEILSIDYNDNEIKKISTLTSEIVINSLLHVIEYNISHPIAKFLYEYSSMNTYSNLITKVDKTNIFCGGIESLIQFDTDKTIKIYIGNSELYQNTIKSSLSLTDKIVTNCKLIYIFNDLGTIYATLTIETKVIQANLDYIKKLATKYDLYILTGDNCQSTDYLRNYIDEENIITNQNPWSKQIFVENLKKQKNAIIMMVGDSHNDSLSLNTSDIGVGIGLTSNLVEMAADLLLVNTNKLSKLNDFLNIAHRFHVALHVNIILSLIFNIGMLPLAAGYYYPKIHFTVIKCVLSMTISSIVVIINSITIIYSEKFTNRQIIAKSSLLLKTIVLGFIYSVNNFKKKISEYFTD